ncbi:unnamed protein product [Ilex paraguariensis]|uniref:Uncharacterized protein n=1 Tax=Ilex paraguariensis TaxID=185542 RepID=A0ABC8TQ59_9AQUA
MTLQEERLVLELHSKWGNRWSRIAQKLPGRTDNEIKNYWRTHMRKKAQEKKRAISSSSSDSNCSSASSNSPPEDSVPVMESKERTFYDIGGLDVIAPRGKNTNTEEEKNENGFFSMDEIWKDLAFPEHDHAVKPVSGGYSEEECNFSCQTIASPIWDYGPESLWMMDEAAVHMFLPTSEQCLSLYGHESSFLTG